MRLIKINYKDKIEQKTNKQTKVGWGPLKKEDFKLIIEYGQ